MRLYKFIFAIVTLLVCFPLFAEDVEQITDSSVPFIYESRSKLPIQKEKLAELISMDYRRARDEFTRHDLFSGIKPVIEEKLESAKKTNNFLVRVNSRLGTYDFSHNVFPTGFSDTTFIPFENDYALDFSNGKVLEFLPMKLSEAKKLSSVLQESRNMTAVLYLSIKSAKEKKLRYYSKKTLTAKVDKVEFYTEKGEKIATVNY